MPHRLRLKEIKLSGFKSFKSIGDEPQPIPFGDVTILIGANGVGKSNLVSFFQMLNHLTTGALAKFIGEKGNANTFLHYGSRTTHRIQAKLTFDDSEGTTNNYQFTLSHAARDTLIFTEESFDYRLPRTTVPKPVELKVGGSESALYKNLSDGDDAFSRIMLGILNNCRAYQFHDTSSTARIRNGGHIRDTSYLRNGGDNLASFLYGMRESSDGRPYYERIVRHVRMVMPQFGDFELKPSASNSDFIFLDWRESSNDYLFGPHQISDGSLRFMALAALLLQPPGKLPELIVIDEPELGLHPSALSVLASMVRIASENAQIILATQAPRLLDEFDAHEIVVMERDERHRTTVFKTLDEEKLAEWLEEYSLSDLWEKNVLGGKP